MPDARALGFTQQQQSVHPSTQTAANATASRSKVSAPASKPQQRGTVAGSDAARQQPKAVTTDKGKKRKNQEPGPQPPTKRPKPALPSKLAGMPSLATSAEQQRQPTATAKGAAYAGKTRDRLSMPVLAASAVQQRQPPRAGKTRDRLSSGVQSGQAGTSAASTAKQRHQKQQSAPSRLAATASPAQAPAQHGTSNQLGTHLHAKRSAPSADVLMPHAKRSRLSVQAHPDRQTSSHAKAATVTKAGLQTAHAANPVAGASVPVKTVSRATRAGTAAKAHTLGTAGSGVDSAAAQANKSTSAKRQANAAKPTGPTPAGKAAPGQRDKHASAAAAQAGPLVAKTGKALTAGKAAPLPVKTAKSSVASKVASAAVKPGRALPAARIMTSKAGASQVASANGHTIAMALDSKLGCSKCRFVASGCTKCRAKQAGQLTAGMPSTKRQ